MSTSFRPDVADRVVDPLLAWGFQESQRHRDITARQQFFAKLNEFVCWGAWTDDDMHLIRPAPNDGIYCCSRKLTGLSEHEVAGWPNLRFDDSLLIAITQSGRHDAGE
jgi:hypothetical protein